MEKNEAYLKRTPELAHVLDFSCVTARVHEGEKLEQIIENTQQGKKGQFTMLDISCNEEKDVLNILTSLGKSMLKRINVIYAMRCLTTKVLSIIESCCPKLEILYGPTGTLESFDYKFKKLKILVLYNCGLKNIPNLANLPSLEFLDIGNNNIGKCSSKTIIAHSKLISLLLCYHYCKELALNTPKLEYLNLNNSTISRITGMDKTNIKTLLIGRSSITIGRDTILPPCVENISYLIMGNDAIQFKQLWSLKNIKKVLLCGNGTFSDLSVIPESVERLYLNPAIKLVGKAAKTYQESKKYQQMLIGEFEIEDGDKYIPNERTKKCNDEDFVNAWTDRIESETKTPNIYKPEEERKLEEPMTDKSIVEEEEDPYSNTEGQHPRTKAVFRHTELANKIEKALLKGDEKVDQEKLIDIVLGAASGDALGCSTEFLDEATASFAVDIYPIPALKYPDGFFSSKLYHATLNSMDTHRSRWESGDWTDDTDQCIVVLDSLGAKGVKLIEKEWEKKGELDESLIRPVGIAVKNWSDYGIADLRDKCGCGLGKTVCDVIYSDGYEDAPLTVSYSTWLALGRRTASNGAVMRSWCTLFMKSRSLAEALFQAQLVASSTHSDPRAYGAALACVTVMYLLIRGVKVSLALNAGQAMATAILRDDTCNSKLEDVLKDLNAYSRCSELTDLPLGKKMIGYCYKTMGSGFTAVRQYNKATELEHALIDISRKGGDADTNGALLGALFVSAYGVDDLPMRGIVPAYRRYLIRKCIKWLSY